MLKKILLIQLFLAFAGTALLFNSCADDPSSLGLQFVPPEDTTGVRLFDSYTDSMGFGFQNIKKHVNTRPSPYLVVGQKDNYTSRGLLRFYNITADYDSATVVSAELRLKYRNYYFPSSASDSLGTVAFNIVRIQNSINFETFTLDSVTSSTFGTTPFGNASVTPTDTNEEVNITLDPQLVKDWLEAAADTGYSVKNYGIALDPQAGSNVLKGFYSMHAGSGFSPQLFFIVNKNGDIDTVTHTIVETMFLADADVAPIPGRFLLHSGISYYELMKFYINSIPSTATINDAKILLYLDSANSIFTNAANRSFKANYLTDSITLAFEDFDFLSTNSNTALNEYQIRFVFPFQRWMRGDANHGLLLSAENNRTDLSKYVFFGLDSPDPAKRPRVIIRYTPRITPDNIKKDEVKYENAE